MIRKTLSTIGTNAATATAVIALAVTSLFAGAAVQASDAPILRAESSRVGLAALPTAASAITPPEMTVSGALRCDATTGVWSVINDSGHDPYGIGTITTTSTHVRVNHTAMTTVGTFAATPDETYVQNNIEVGASVGLSYTDLKFSKNGVAVNPTTICYAWSNVWLAGWGYTS